MFIVADETEAEEYMEDAEPEPEKSQMSLSELLNQHHNDGETDDYYGEEYEEEDY